MRGSTSRVWATPFTLMEMELTAYPFRGRVSTRARRVWALAPGGRLVNTRRGAPPGSGARRADDAFKAPYSSSSDSTIHLPFFSASFSRALPV